MNQANYKHIDYVNFLNQHFNNFVVELNQYKNDFIINVKKDAIRNFNNYYFPSNKVEDWKYIPIDSLLQNKYVPLRSIKNRPLKKKYDFYTNDNIMVLSNGSIIQNNITNKKITLKSLDTALINDFADLEANYSRYATIDSGFAALNVAFSLDGLYLKIPNKVVLEETLNFIFLTGSDEENLYTPIRNFIHIGDNTEVSLLFYYKGDSNKTYLNSVHNNIIVGKNSFVKIYEIDDEDPQSHHINKTLIRANKGSQVTHYRFSLGGKILRNDTNVIMDGQEVTANLYGVIVAKDKELYDNHTLIDHALPNCYSNEVYKSVLNDQAKNVFNGKIIVRKDAQKTNAYQQNKNLLISNDAVVNAKPQLEIFADDVKCTHGATVGQLDKEGLFYLLSRGISKKLATQIMIHAFVSEIFEDITNQKLVEFLSQKINNKLNLNYE